MIIDCTSDIHVDHYWRDPKTFRNFLNIFPGGDILIIAGDISSVTESGKLKAKDFFSYVATIYNQVLYVKGNHDFYGADKQTINPDWNYTDIQNVTLLNRDTIEIEGLTFAGCVAWYETGEPLNDLYMIPDAVAFSQRQKKLDFEFLNQLGDTDVLVTHVPLSNLSIHPKFSLNPYNKYYFHPAEDILHRIQPQLHLSGHTHESSQYYVNKCLCVGNPAGYKNEIKTSYTVRRFEFRDTSLLPPVSERT